MLSFLYFYYIWNNFYLSHPTASKMAAASTSPSLFPATRSASNTNTSPSVSNIYGKIHNFCNIFFFFLDM